MRLEDLHGQQLGRYHITGLLGRGGMAAVYRAHDTVLRRDVAIKVLYPQYSHDAALMERFQREAIVAARLDHPNIVPIYDVGEAHGYAYIAMKLLQGRSLADLLRQQRTLAPEQLLPIVAQIAAALDYAHARGVVHRDIKAANILLEPNEQILLADFGIAKSLDAPGLTSTSVLIGTPDYMAPEQIANQPVDGRADIYALGVLVFRCLTGRLPYEGGTEQVLLGHLHGTPPDPSMLVPSLPIALDAVMRRALARQPAQRYATAGEFARALRAAFRSGQTATPVPRHPAAQSASQHAQPRPASNAPTQRGVALPPTAFTTAPRRSDAMVATRQPAARWLLLAFLLLLLIGGGGFVLANTLQRRGDSSVVSTATLPAVIAATELAVPTSAPPDEATPEPTAAITPTDAPTEAPPPTDAPTSVPTNTSQPTSAPTNTSQPTSAPTNTSQPTSAPTQLPTSVPTSAPTDTPTSTPTPTATFTPTPLAANCAIKPVRGFATLLEAQPEVAQRLGCPTLAEQSSSLSEQAFQSGSMLWYAAPDVFYVLEDAGASGTWRFYRKADVDAFKTQPLPERPPPPPGRFVPREGSGFYYIWYHDDDVFEAVGYALSEDEQFGDGGAFQSYTNGMLLFSPTGLGLGPMIYAIYDDGTFEHYADTSASAPQ